VAVGGFAQRLTRLHLQDPQAAEYAAIIVREVRRLEEMLGNILAFSKKQLVCLEDCDLNELLYETLTLESDQQNHAVKVVTEINIPLPPIIGDCRKLRQVVLNLLANARQSLLKGGEIHLRAGCCMLRGEEAVFIQVEDTGGGIPTEILRNIFNPFFSTRPKGTGLGLSISHRIVEQHHGEIEVANGEQGACFTVRLPVRPPAGINGGEPPTSRQEPAEIETGP
jgi:signal transduction histidine kinase